MLGWGIWSKFVIGVCTLIYRQSSSPLMSSGMTGSQSGMSANELRQPLENSVVGLIPDQGWIGCGGKKRKSLT